ncbi:MAG: hypothetical protein ACYDA2_00540 [Acidimicrobiales bacterium]
MTMQGESARRTVEGSTTDAPLTTDLIRSMAISSAELWNDVLQRLAELQESQLVLAQAVADLGAVVRESLPAAGHDALAAGSSILALESGVAASTPLSEPEPALKGRRTRKATRAAHAAAAAEAKAAKAARAVEAKGAKATEAATKSSGRGLLHRRRHGHLPVEQAPIEDAAPRWEAPALLPPPPLVTPPPPLNVVRPPSDITAPTIEDHSSPLHAGRLVTPVFEAAPVFEPAPNAPKPLVYTPATAETANVAVPPAPTFSVAEPLVVPEPTFPPPAAVPVFEAPAPEPVLAGVGARPMTDSASMVSEILSNAPTEAPFAASAPAVPMISEDLTLISKNRKRRLQFRLR